MATYTAYLSTDHADYLTEQGDLRANRARVTHEGHGIVTLDDAAMSILEGFGDDDDGCIERNGATIQMYIGGDVYPVVADDGDGVAVLAATTAALPDMPLAARVVTARRMVDEAKRVYSAVADAAIVDLTRIHREHGGGYSTVALLVGVTGAAINKAVVRHGRRLA